MIKLKQETGVRRAFVALAWSLAVILVFFLGVFVGQIIMAMALR